MSGGSLLDHAQSRSAKLENVILGSNARVGDRAQLKDCELGTGYEAKPGGELRISF